MSHAPLAVAAPHPVIDAVGDYVRTSFERFERVLLTTAAAAAEPRIPRDVDRALRQLEALVEMLTGLAVGLAVGQVTGAIRRGFGEPAREEVALRLAALLREPPPAVTRMPVHATGERPLLGELVGRLQPRLCLHARAAEAMVRAICTALPAVPPSALEQTLPLLRDDDASGLAYAQHVQLGWQHYVAVITGAPAPAVPAGGWRGHEAWQAWSQRLRHPGGAPAAVLTQDEVASRGFVMQIG